MESKINSNKGHVSRNLVYGRTIITSPQDSYPNIDSTYKKLRNKTTYGKRRKTYGSKGKSSIEQ